MEHEAVLKDGRLKKKEENEHVKEMDSGSGDSGFCGGSFGGVFVRRLRGR